MDEATNEWTKLFLDLNDFVMKMATTNIRTTDEHKTDEHNASGGPLGTREDGQGKTRQMLQSLYIFSFGFEII